MAKRIVHQLVDDIDGAVLADGAGESIHFSLDGTAYEIDLSTEHARQLRESFAVYISAGRRSSAAAGGSPRKRASRTPDAARIRTWAAENGHRVSERGRIPAPVVEAYNAAHA